MSTVKIPCPHCHRLNAMDTAKLPPRRFSFKCPGCQGKVVVDPKQLQTDGKPDAAQRSDTATFQSEPPQTASRPDSAAEPAGQTSGEHSVSELDLPPGATFPPGLIAGDRPDTIAQLCELLAPFDCSLEQLESVSDIVGRPADELPPLFLYVTGLAEQPPLKALAPVLGLPPTTRRRVFVALMADNLRTADGSTAFFHQVNLTLKRSEVQTAAAALYSALLFHHRLYRPLFAALEAREHG